MTTKPAALAGNDLPPGVVLSAWNHHNPRYLELKVDNIGYVTIDLESRGFRLGSTTVGRFHGEEGGGARRVYRGRGWQRRIVEDAIAAMLGPSNDEPSDPRVRRSLGIEIRAAEIVAVRLLSKSEAKGWHSNLTDERGPSRGQKDDDGFDAGWLARELMEHPA